MSAPILFFTAGILAGFFVAFLSSRWLARYALKDGDLALLRGARVNAWNEVVSMIDGQIDFHARQGNESVRVALQSYAFWARERAEEARLELASDDREPRG